MKEYTIQIKETLAMTVIVEAKNADHAREIAERNWKNSDYILDADHFKGVAFTIIPDRVYER